MKKKNLYKLYCTVFILICLAPAVCTPFMLNKSSAEKRTLSEFPDFTDSGKINMDFFSEFDTWFSEHFAFRTHLVNADSRVKSSLGISADSDVIVGSDGWLYYGDTVNDYLNINTLSQWEIENIAHNLRMINDYCKANGAEFVFFSAPNKNSLYPENMPYNYVPADNVNNYSMLAEILSEDDFFLDMKSALLSAESSIPLYHKTDTHWNNMGAYVGHTAIMNKTGRNPCSAGTGWYTKNDRLGDLAEMLYPAESAKDTQVYNDYEFTYSYQGIFRGLDDITIDTTSQSGDGVLLMFRDSYGEAILPYMAECFSTAEFSRAVPYRLDNISGKTVVLEIVERNISDLQKYAPVMPAPVADISNIDVVQAENVDFKVETSGKYVHVYGVVPESYFSGSSNIFVEADGVVYEAFNCFEDKLLDREGERCKTGFSLYIPDTATDNIRIFINKES